MKEKFRVTGMTCSACSLHVEKQVSYLMGVKSVSVSLLTNSMVVEYDEETVSPEGCILDTSTYHLTVGANGEVTSDDLDVDINDDNKYYATIINKNETNHFKYIGSADAIFTRGTAGACKCLGGGPRTTTDTKPHSKRDAKPQSEPC